MARRCPVSPNALTLLALLFALAAAALLAAGARWNAAFPLAILAGALGGALDLLDGVVAREQGLVSRWGDFLDHFCDRVSDTALAAGWIFGAGVSPAIGLFTLAAVTLNGYTGTQIEATFHVASTPRPAAASSSSRFSAFLSSRGSGATGWRTPRSPACPYSISSRFCSASSRSSASRSGCGTRGALREERDASAAPVQ